MATTHSGQSTTTAERIYRYLTQADTKLRSLLLRNGRSIRLAEDALRGIALILPGGDAEIRAEAAGVLLSLLQIYRDAGSSGMPKETVQFGGTQISAQSLIIVLSTLRAVELLVEMLAERRRRSKWGAVASIEMTKMVIRLMLILCRQTNDFLSEEMPPAKEVPPCTCGMGKIEGSKYLSVKTGKRSGRKVYVLHETTPQDKALNALFDTAYERRSAWIMRMLGSEKNCPACSSPTFAPLNGHNHTTPNGTLPPTAPSTQEAPSMNTMNTMNTLGETLYIIRPVMQLLVIRRYGWKSWRAWLVALLVDLAARKLRSQNSNLLHDEKQRRNMQMILYLARSPFFDTVVRRVLETTAHGVRKIPLVGGIASSSMDLATALQTYWFYTAAS